MECFLIETLQFQSMPRREDIEKWLLHTMFLFTVYLTLRVSDQYHRYEVFETWAIAQLIGQENEHFQYEAVSHYNNEEMRMIANLSDPLVFVRERFAPICFLIEDRKKVIEFSFRCDFPLLDALYDHLEKMYCISAIMMLLYYGDTIWNKFIKLWKLLRS